MVDVDDVLFSVYSCHNSYIIIIIILIFVIIIYFLFLYCQHAVICKDDESSKDTKEAGWTFLVQQAFFEIIAEEAVPEVLTSYRCPTRFLLTPHSPPQKPQNHDRTTIKVKVLILQTQGTDWDRVLQKISDNENI